MASAEPSPIEHLQTLLSEEVLYTVQSFFEIKVVHEEGGTLFFFLNQRLHELFHYFVKQTPCCNTKTPCATIAIKGSLTKDQFFLLYEKDSSVHSTHEKKDRGCTLQYCICPLSPNNATDVTNLDFTIINCLMKTCRKTPAGDPKWLKDILDVRNELSHLGETSCISDDQLKNWWVKLENAAVKIAGTIGVVHQNGVRRRISKIKTNQSHLEKQMAAFNTRVDKLEQKILNTLENMGVNIDGVRFRITTADLLDDEPDRSQDLAITTCFTDPKKCTVVWKFSVPGDWNVKEMQKKLDCLSIIGDFNVEFVYQGSLIVHTTTDRFVVSDVEVFREATEEFLLLFTKRLRIPVMSGMRPVNVALSIWDHNTTKASSSRSTTFVEEAKRGFHSPTVPTEKEPERMREAQVIKQTVLPSKLTFMKKIKISGGLADCTSLAETFVLCDSKNDRLIFYEKTSDNVRYIPLSGKPWHATAINNTTVAVGMWHGTVQIFDVINNKTIRTFQVKGNIGGITFHDGHLFVLLDTKKIQVMDVQGEVLTSIQTQKDRIPNYITVDKNKIVYSDGLRALFSLYLSGDDLWQCDISMIRGIRGVTQDNKGNVYITGNYSHNVVVIAPDGKQTQQLLSESDGLKYPMGICFNRRLNVILVCNRDDFALLYKIEK